MRVSWTTQKFVSNAGTPEINYETFQLRRINRSPYSWEKGGTLGSLAQMLRYCLLETHLFFTQQRE